MKIIFTIFWFLAFLKFFLFWLWLWQLKDYRMRRFMAHFETRKIAKSLQSFYRIKRPAFTKKATAITLVGFIALALGFWRIYFLEELWFKITIIILLLIFPKLVSLLIFLFQIPTFIVKKSIFKKAGNKRKQFKNLTVIGITGSYGKTVCKDFLSQILATKFKVLKTKENLNSEISIAKAILNDLNESHQVFVAEIGAYKKGEVKQACQMLKPSIGVITGINEQHLATFGSQQNIIEGKYELIESLLDNGLAVFNGKSHYTQEMFNKTKIAKKFVLPQELGHGLAPWEKQSLSMAVEVAKRLGMSDVEIGQAVEKIKTKFVVKEGIGGLKVIDNTYSANPDSIIAHLEYLGETFPNNKKIIVMPSLIELGKASKAVHQRIGESIGQICDLAIITNPDRFRELKAGVLKAGMTEQNILLITHPPEILEKIKATACRGDVVLLESRIPQSILYGLSR